jgi:hypothetical protein
LFSFNLSNTTIKVRVKQTKLSSVNGISIKVKGWLKRKPKYSNEISLRMRIEDIIKRYGAEFVEINQKLKFILDVCLLSELGFTLQEINDNLIRKNNKYRREIGFS